jgi:REP element-mobilizing transposase RayT
MNLVTPDVSIELYPYIGGIINGEKGKIIQIGGISNHIHILCLFHPAISVSEMMRHIKGNSSKWLHEKGNAMFLWQKGYGAFSVSESAADSVRKYIVNQEIHHRKYSFEDEYIAILKKHNIQYDENYIWE